MADIDQQYSDDEFQDEKSPPKASKQPTEIESEVTYEDEYGDDDETPGDEYEDDTLAASSASVPVLNLAKVNEGDDMYDADGFTPQLASFPAAGDETSYDENDFTQSTDLIPPPTKGDIEESYNDNDFVDMKANDSDCPPPINTLSTMQNDNELIESSPVESSPIENVAVVGTGDDQMNVEKPCDDVEETKESTQPIETTTALCTSDESKGLDSLQQVEKETPEADGVVPPLQTSIKTDENDDVHVDSPEVDQRDTKNDEKPSQLVENSDATVFLSESANTEVDHTSDVPSEDAGSIDPAEPPVNVDLTEPVPLPQSDPNISSTTTIEAIEPTCEDDVTDLTNSEEVEIPQEQVEISVSPALVVDETSRALPPTSQSEKNGNRSMSHEDQTVQNDLDVRDEIVAACGPSKALESQPEESTTSSTLEVVDGETRVNEVPVVPSTESIESVQDGGGKDSNAAEGEPTLQLIEEETVSMPQFVDEKSSTSPLLVSSSRETSCDESGAKLADPNASEEKIIAVDMSTVKRSFFDDEACLGFSTEGPTAEYTIVDQSAPILEQDDDLMNERQERVPSRSSTPLRVVAPGSEGAQVILKKNTEQRQRSNSLKEESQKGTKGSRHASTPQALENESIVPPLAKKESKVKKRLPPKQAPASQEAAPPIQPKPRPPQQAKKPKAPTAPSSSLLDSSPTVDSPRQAPIDTTYTMDFHSAQKDYRPWRQDTSPERRKPNGSPRRASPTKSMKKTIDPLPVSPPKYHFDPKIDKMKEEWLLLNMFRQGDASKYESFCTTTKPAVHRPTSADRCNYQSHTRRLVNPKRKQELQTLQDRERNWVDGRSRETIPAYDSILDKYCHTITSPLVQKQIYTSVDLSPQLAYVLEKRVQAQRHAEMTFLSEETPTYGRPVKGKHQARPPPSSTKSNSTRKQDKALDNDIVSIKWSTAQLKSDAPT